MLRDITLVEENNETDKDFLLSVGFIDNLYEKIKNEANIMKTLSYSDSQLLFEILTVK